MATEVDDLDLKIIQHLHEDGRVSLTELAGKVGSSRQTVTNRLKRLIDEKIILIRGGLNLKKFLFKMASVGLEIKSDTARKDMEIYLRNCPRVLSIFRIPEKANIHLMVWGEDDQNINSTIESFRDLQNVDIIYTHYLGTPIHGDPIINVEMNNNAESPCGMNCANCSRYSNGWCVGCPTSSSYRNPLLK